MLLYTDDLFLEHDTGDHPERAFRLKTAVDRLSESGLTGRCEQPTWAAASLEQVTRIHQPDYVNWVDSFVRQGGGRIEADTVACPKSYEVAMHAAGAVCDAVGKVASGAEKRSLCLVRPPGHHALAAAPMGFCLFNNAAIAAREAINQHGLDRVLIVDWDVHHGNGTQDSFWEDEQVGFFSAHRWPFYPGSGARQETGSGKGLGTTCNLPLEFGTSRDDYLGQFTNALGGFVAKINPQLIIISAGFDAHREDPVGSLGLEAEDFGKLTRLLIDMADVCAEGRLISVLEGGYNPQALADSLEAHLTELLGA